MLQPWRTGRIIRIENETSATKRYWIQVPELQAFDFSPGQFVTLDLPIHEKANKRWRSYSIASWPDGTNVFELVIVLLEGGAGTTYLFEHAVVGTELVFRGPQGVFVLPQVIDRDIFMICTGTGIAPFRSMAHYIALNAIPHKNIYMIFGCRQRTDALYGEEMKAFEQQLPGFLYLPTFSRENPDDHSIRRGYVHAVYEEIVIGKMEPSMKQHLSAGVLSSADNTAGETAGQQMEQKEPVPAYFYLCGWKNMVDEAKQRILSLGYDKKSIHLELYG